jgi:hypothetical protein
MHSLGRYDTKMACWTQMLLYHLQLVFALQSGQTPRPVEIETSKLVPTVPRSVSFRWRRGLAEAWSKHRILGADVDTYPPVCSQPKPYI